MTSFDGSAARKAAALASYDGAGESAALIDPGATEDAVAAFAASAGLPAALVQMLRAMALCTFDTAERIAAGRRLLDAVPAGADCANTASRWVGWALLDDTVGTAAVIADPDALALAREVGRCHRDIDDTPVAAAEWRRLRNACVALQDGLPQGAERSAVITVGNGCWDFARTSGAAADVFRGWIDMQGARAYAAEGFTTAELGEFGDRNYDAWLDARERLKDVPGHRNADIHALTRDILLETHPAIGRRGYHVMDVRERYVADALARGIATLNELYREREAIPVAG